MRVLDFVAFIKGIDKLRAEIREHNRKVDQLNNER